MSGMTKKPRILGSAAPLGLRPLSAADDAPSDRGRWSSGGKAEIVMRLFKGETLDMLSRELGVSTTKLAEWRDDALAAMRNGLRVNTPDHRDQYIRDLKAKVGEQTMIIELLEYRVNTLEDGSRPQPRRPTP